MSHPLELPLAIGLLMLGGCLSAAESPLPAVPDDQEAIAKLQEAQGYLTQGDYKQAAKLAREVAAQPSDSPGILQLTAEVLYRSGESEASLPLFDKVVQLVPQRAPQNWQRGIALSSVARWKEGAEQFKTHHDVNPDDVENSAWYFLCVAKQQGIDAARETVIPSRGDGRQPMMSVLKMLKQEMQPEEVLAAAVANTSPGRERQLAKFYADLYVGLYYDSLDDATRAKQYLQRSLGYEVGGYMADVARVYLQDRFPDSDSAHKKQE